MTSTFRAMKALIAGAVLFVLLLGLLCWFPPNDSPVYEECVKSHTEWRLQPKAGLGFRVGGGMELAPADECDQWRQHTCKEWERARNFLGRTYRRCVDYD
jgi:hypothetical protein